MGIVFFVELGMLASFAIWGFSLQIPTIAKAILGLGVPAAVIVVWGHFFAPKATHPLGEPLNGIGELTLFVLAAAALYGAGYHKAAIVFGIVAVVFEIIGLIWK